MRGLRSSQLSQDEQSISSPTNHADEGNDYKTAFRTKYGQLEYRVVQFELTNVPATILPIYSTN